VGVAFGIAAIINDNEAKNCSPCSARLARRERERSGTDRALVFANISNVTVPLGLVGSAVGAYLVLSAGPGHKVALAPVTTRLHGGPVHERECEAMKRKIAVVAMVLGVTVIACQVVAGIERVDKTDPVAVDAGPDAIAVDSSIADSVRARPAADEAPRRRRRPRQAARHLPRAPSRRSRAVGDEHDRARLRPRSVVHVRTRPGTASTAARRAPRSKAVLRCRRGIDNQIFNFARDYAAFIARRSGGQHQRFASPTHQTVSS